MCVCFVGFHVNLSTANCNLQRTAPQSKPLTTDSINLANDWHVVATRQTCGEGQAYGGLLVEHARVLSKGKQDPGSLGKGKPAEGKVRSERENLDFQRPLSSAFQGKAPRGSWMAHGHWEDFENKKPILPRC